MKPEDIQTMNSEQLAAWIVNPETRTLRKPKPEYDLYLQDWYRRHTKRRGKHYWYVKEGK